LRLPGRRGEAAVPGFIGPGARHRTPYGRHDPGYHELHLAGFDLRGNVRFKASRECLSERLVSLMSSTSRP